MKFSGSVGTQFNAPAASVFVGFTALVAAYVCIGALVFHLLEDSDLRETSNATACVMELMALARHGIENPILRVEDCLQTPALPPDWGFASSLLFAFSVTTTIGYGHVSPVTVWGRLFFMLYAVIGIPMTLVYLANVGKFMTSGVQQFCQTCQTAMYKHFGKTREETQQIQTSTIFLVGFVLYIAMGTLLFPIYENTSFFDAFYFNFVTLTTIGFGDIYPKNNKAIPLSLIYISIGLALTSISFEILGQYLRKLHYFGRKLKGLAQMTIWFGGKEVSVGGLIGTFAETYGLDPIDTDKLDTIVETAIKKREEHSKPVSPLIAAGAPMFKTLKRRLKSIPRPPQLDLPEIPLASPTEVADSQETSPESPNVGPQPGIHKRKLRSLDPDITLVPNSIDRGMRRPTTMKMRHDARQRYACFQKEWTKYQTPHKTSLGKLGGSTNTIY